MRAKTYLDLIRSVQASSLSEDAQAICIEIFRQNAAADGHEIIDWSERVQYARHLLDLGDSRAQIRDRVMAKYGIGRSQAYTVIADALNVRRFAQKPDAGAV